MSQQLERYVHGPVDTWPGYCVYDRSRGLYQYWDPRSVKPTLWSNLQPSKLAALLEAGSWMLEVPAELRLPEGF